MWSPDLSELAHRVDEADLLVGFNWKYDFHWGRKCGLPVEGKRYWCVQVADFLLGRFEHLYPSLNEVCAKHELGQKIDVIQNEYWDKGINTHEIPRNILGEYAERDSVLTYRAYLKQQELIPPHQRVLFSLYMQDLAVLQEIEWNGLHYDAELIKQKEKECTDTVLRVQQELKLHHNVPDFNWNSNDHLSALLYGGDIVRVEKEPDGVFKTGQKAGMPKFRNKEVVYKLPRMYKPLRGSSLAKEGVWSVGEEFLRKLPKSELIDGILTIKEQEKLNNTYYKGLQEDHAEKHYAPEYLHGQFNQVVARTGRLSSSAPNMQNIPTIAREVLTSRYE